MNTPPDILLILAILAGAAAAAVWFGKPWWERKKIHQKASQNDPAALCALAELHYHGKHAKKDWNKAFSLFSDSARLGHLPAWNRLGSLYHAGHGTEKR